MFFFVQILKFIVERRADVLKLYRIFMREPTQAAVVMAAAATAPVLVPAVAPLVSAAAPIAAIAAAAPIAAATVSTAISSAENLNISPSTSAGTIRRRNHHYRNNDPESQSEDEEDEEQRMENKKIWMAINSMHKKFDVSNHMRSRSRSRTPQRQVGSKKGKK